MTRTEIILEAITRELDRRSRFIDSDEGLRSVRFDVKLDRRTGHPRCVITTLEAEREGVDGRRQAG